MDSIYRKIKYYRDGNGKMVPYVSYYTQANKVFLEDEGGGDAGGDGGEYDYSPGIDVPSYGDKTRDELPQINYRDFFNKFGPSRIVRKKKKCTELDPTQCEFSEQKVLDIMGSEEKLKPILVSKDGKIIDGHHRWLAVHNLGYKEIEVDEVDCPYCDFMDEIKDKDYVTFKSIHESKQLMEAAEYKGKKVTLNKPFRTPGESRKFAVYVKNPKGKVVIVRFGDPNMEIKRDDPERRKNFLARHKCSTANDKTTPRYWSCKWGWGKKALSEADEVLANVLEETINPSLLIKRDKILKTMRRDQNYFKRQYGKDWESVMKTIALTIAKGGGLKEDFTLTDIQKKYLASKTR